MKEKRRWLVLVLPFLAVWSIGCSGDSIHPVRGKVVFSDGEPATELAGGTVEFESTEKPISARGTINQDGSFELTTKSTDDGAYVGKHRVLVREPDPESVDMPEPRILDRKFERYETSGLTETIKPGVNQVTIKVSKVDE